ncbi:MAG: serine protease [Methylohalobius sp.]|nr:serine protease [Methylohalobius sp.]
MLRFLLIALTLGWDKALGVEGLDPRLTRSEVKVVAYGEANRVAVGSGVVVGEGKGATSCHVTRTAHAIALFQGAMRYEVLAQRAAPERDVCLLQAKLNLPAVQLGEAVAGEAAYLYGYPGGVGLSVTKTQIRSLHPYQDGQLIELEAGFVHGASGGALFNEHGQLIGLATFMQRKPPAFYAIPAGWVTMVLSRQAGPIQPLLERPFWQTDSNFLEDKL